MRRIGLMCGTFNPVHIGHLLIAEFAFDQFGLEKVLFVTSPVPPHRQKDKDLLSGEARHEMVAAAVASTPHFEASTIELERDGPSYTIDTINWLQNVYGNKVKICLIIGGDNASELPKWFKANEIMQRCLILVAPRMVRVISESEAGGDEDALDSQVVHGFEYESRQEFESRLRKAMEEHSKKNSDNDSPGGATASASAAPAAPAETGFENFELIEFPGIGISGTTVRSRISNGKSINFMVPAAVVELIQKNNYYKRSTKK